MFGLLLAAAVGAAGLALWSLPGRSASGDRHRAAEPPPATTPVSDTAVGTAPGPASAAGATPDAIGAATTDPADRTDSSIDLTRIKQLPPAAQLPEAESQPAMPVALRIPDIGVGNGPVIPVGVEPNGELEVPDASQVGWYRFGSGPGRPGSTVLAAHIAYNGVDGVFRRVADAEPGALVDVVMDDGRILGYRIDEVVEYQKSDLPAEELFDEAGPDRLVLITCGGAFNPTLRSYESNVVAYARPVDLG